MDGKPLSELEYAVIARCFELEYAVIARCFENKGQFVYPTNRSSSYPK
jgi:hypothetical protein